MFSVIKHLDGSYLFTVSLWRDDGRRHLLAHRVIHERVQEITTEFAKTVKECRGVDPALPYLPLRSEN